MCGGARVSARCYWARKDEAVATVLEELLEWSVGRPAWQRDALRRFLVKGELSDEDFRDLAEVCKATHGLAEQVDTHPLTKADVPTRGG